MKFIKLVFLLLMMGSVAQAEEATFDSILDSMEDAVPERTTEGQIQSIDLAGRTGVIDGFLYHFGPATDAYPLQVRMMGKNYGSLEMLRPGMHVSIRYFQAGQHRVANKLTQINESEET
ncbi:MAG: hypothetical protein ACI9FB_003152 [Candidatus Azotimanducaceae bacterium]|jgi:hypothetical protein